MQRSAFEVESSDSNFPARGRREAVARAAEREKHTPFEKGNEEIGGARRGVGRQGGVESCGRIRCPFPGKSRRSIETCIMAAIIHFLSDRGDLLYGGCSVHASSSLSIPAHMYARATIYPVPLFQQPLVFPLFRSGPLETARIYIYITASALWLIVFATFLLAIKSHSRDLEIRLHYTILHVASF